MKNSSGVKINNKQAREREREWVGVSFESRVEKLKGLFSKNLLRNAKISALNKSKNKKKELFHFLSLTHTLNCICREKLKV